jgi:precorrin-6B C5,15-methyltransferase / cobalt-precorrin-6B C5,C15-methyltransferase
MITVLGLPRHFAEADLAALSQADVVAGGARHLEIARHLFTPRASEVVIGGDVGVLLDHIAGAARPVVLASGDPGYFGVVRALAARFGPHNLDVRPAVPAVSAAFAAVGLPWDDAQVVTAHGRDPAPAVAVCRRFPKVAVLTAPGYGPAHLARALQGLDRELVVAEQLGGPAERITSGTVDDIAAGDWSDPNVVLVLDQARVVGAKGHAAPPRATSSGWALDDAAFTYRDGMITKSEVRALALGWLGPGPGDLVWDIGAGSGSVGVEAARLGAAVVAVERDPEQCARIAANAARHDVPVDVVCDEAPRALAGLPDPDAVFVGGGGTSVALAAADRAHRVVVAALVTVERVGPVQRGLAEQGWHVDATMLSAARVVPLAAGHRLHAQHPVFLVRGRRR